MKNNSQDLVWRSLLFMSVVVSGVLIFECERTFSQVTPDNTLGDESSVVNTRDATSDSIDGGAVRGQNLFHSFEEFNVGEDQGVYFANPEAVSNIFSRVTGNDVSNILGTLGVDGAANLYLINPNGIVFGEGASLDVQGSFAATTANGIEFGDRGFFSAVNPESPKLLTINPAAYLFNQAAPGAIINSSKAAADFNPATSFDDNFFGLRVPDGQNLLLLGGDVKADGGGLVASGGRIDIGAVTGEGVVGINVNGSLNILDSIARGNASLTNGAGFLVAGDGGGDMAIAAKNISLDSASSLNAGILSNLGSPDAQAGDITINATDNLTVDSSRVANEVGLEAVGNGGNIFINANSLQVFNGSQIGSPTFGRGNGGNLAIRASNVELSGTSSDGQLFSGLFATVQSPIQGNGGNLTINTDKLSLSDRAQISASTFSQGDSGNISITANNSIALNASSYIVNNVQDISATGDAGKIDMTTGSLSAKNGSQINSFTRGQGNAGDITIQATDLISFDGFNRDDSYSSAFSTVEAGGVGDGGNINITAGSLSLTNGGQLNANVREASDSLSGGRGQGGNINIKVDDTLTIANGNFKGISTGLGIAAIGNGGDINIQAGSLVIRNRGEIDAITFGQGDAGKIIINTDSLSLTNNSFIGTSISGQGDAGKIIINTDFLDLTNKSFIDASILGQGDAGGIDIQVSNTATLDKASGISSSVNSAAIGNAGKININASSLNLTANSGILTGILGQGNAGGITINSKSLNLTADSGIFANLGVGAVGSGGDIRIQTENLVVKDGGLITSSTSAKGDSGDLFITVDNLISLDASSYIANNVSDINAVGNAGNINIKTGSLSATNGSQINSFTRGQGNAGDITIQANNSITFEGFNSDGLPSGLNTTVEVGALGNGGNISLTSGDIRLRDNSDIRTNVFNNTGNGGNISMTADSIFAFDDSDILASAPKGIGGDIALNTPAYFGENFTLNSLISNPDSLEKNSRADVSATGGVSSGAVNIPDVSFVQNSLNILPDDSINTDELVANSCVVPMGDRQEGKFIITGIESLPVSPGGGRPSHYSTGEVRNLPEKQSSWQPGDPIIEPQGAYRLANGKLVLSRECSQ
jgi:filamentous hemagglutinin family protein